MVEDVIGLDGLWVKSYTVGGKSCNTRSYSKWMSMRNRCSDKYKDWKPTYTGCSISDNFKDFQFFTSWHTQQVGYDRLDYQLDKDILCNFKVYSEDTCVLVPQELNSFFLDRVKSCGPYPHGISFSKVGQKLCVQIGIKGRSSYRGLFDTIEDAEVAYKQAKEAEAYRWYERLRDGEFIVDGRVIERMRTWTLEGQ